MPLDNDDLVVPAGIVNGTGGVANLDVGSLCPDGLWVGTCYDEGEGSGPYSVYWNDGTHAASVDADNLRKVQNVAVSMVGKTVNWQERGPAFRGIVEWQFELETSDTGGNGTYTEVCTVKTALFTYVAPLSQLEEVQ